MKRNRLIAALAATALIGSAAVTAAVPAQAATRKVVVWAPFSGAGLDLWKAAGKRIEAANPGLTVEIVGNTDMEKSLAAINAGTGPDISVANGVGNVGWFCGTGAWQNLNSLIAGSNGLNMAKTFTPSGVKGTTSNGVRCALPFSSEVFGFYYNKTLLKKAGITSVPRTTSQLLTASKKLTTFAANGDIKTAGYVPWAGYADNDMASLFLGQMFGASWYNSKGKSAFATDPAWARAFAWQKSFIANVYGGGSFAVGSRKLQKFIAGAGDFWGTQNDFITGRVAMIAHADWMAQFWCSPDWVLQPCKNPQVNFGTAPLPVAPDLYKTWYGSGIVGSNTLGISKGTKNLAAAWTVLKALTTDVTLAVKWTNMYGDPPSLMAARTSSALDYPEFYFTFYQIMGHPKSGYHALMNVSEHLDETGLQQLMAAYGSGKAPYIKTQLARLASRVDAIIARNAR